MVAKEQQYILSAEVLITGEVALYARRNYEPEEKEKIALAENGLGPKKPLRYLLNCASSSLKKAMK